MKLRASLEAVKTRKNVSDDVVQTVVLNIYASAEEIGELISLYQQPLQITIEVKE